MQFLEVIMQVQEVKMQVLRSNYAAPRSDIVGSVEKETLLLKKDIKRHNI